MVACKLLVCSLLVLVLFLADKCQGKGCPRGWSYNEGSCYKTTTPLTWYNARLYCLSVGGDLVVIKSDQENSFVARLAYAQTKAHHLWIGLHRYTNTIFHWVDGAPISDRYKNWASREPSSVSEECGMLYSTPRHKYEKWNDALCSTNFIAMCERSAE